jgi:hypothetical protein
MSNDRDDHDGPIGPAFAPGDELLVPHDRRFRPDRDCLEGHGRRRAHAREAIVRLIGFRCSRAFAYADDQILEVASLLAARSSLLPH